MEQKSSLVSCMAFMVTVTLLPFAPRPKKWNSKRNISWIYKHFTLSEYGSTRHKRPSKKLNRYFFISQVKKRGKERSKSISPYFIILSQIHTLDKGEKTRTEMAGQTNLSRYCALTKISFIHILYYCTPLSDNAHNQ